ncbi:MAG TPA: hypothetical protein VE989_06900 [Sphingomicrobium sp.]|nr:hypothetical protein [Sphingomicrobium sp.]
MDTHSPAPARDGAMFFGRDELAEGLMLFRAGTLKMIRLQLALEQRDRRVALAAVDDLVALDRQLQDYLAQLPSVPVPGALMAELEVERAALNREKLTLAAGVIRREAPAPEGVLEADAPAWGSRDYALADQRRRSRGLRRLAGALILVAAAGGAAFVPGVADRVQAVVAGAAR